MTSSEPARTGIPRAGSILLVAVVLSGSALAGVLMREPPVASSGMAAASESAALPSPVLSPSSAGAGARQGAVGAADGLIPDGTTVFADGIPGIAKLDPALLGALRHAATDAASDGVQILVTSGWRSHAYQEQLFRQAVATYGSAQAAAQWVATPGESAHETGAAVDLGPSGALAWLSDHGAAHGLCQIYRNEPWHYELRPDAVSQGCPPMYPDPSHDPRLQP